MKENTDTIRAKEIIAEMGVVKTKKKAVKTKTVTESKVKKTVEKKKPVVKEEETQKVEKVIEEKKPVVEKEETLKVEEVIETVVEKKKTPQCVDLSSLIILKNFNGVVFLSRKDNFKLIQYSLDNDLTSAKKDCKKALREKFFIPECIKFNILGKDGKLYVKFEDEEPYSEKKVNNFVNEWQNTNKSRKLLIPKTNFEKDGKEIKELFWKWHNKNISLFFREITEDYLKKDIYDAYVEYMAGDKKINVINNLSLRNNREILKDKVVVTIDFKEKYFKS